MVVMAGEVVISVHGFIALGQARVECMDLAWPSNRLAPRTSPINTCCREKIFAVFPCAPLNKPADPDIFQVPGRRIGQR